MSGLYQALHQPGVMHGVAFGSSSGSLEEEVQDLGWTVSGGTGEVNVDCCYVSFFGVQIGIDLFSISGQIDLYGLVDDPMLRDTFWPGLD